MITSYRDRRTNLRVFWGVRETISGMKNAEIIDVLYIAFLEVKAEIKSLAQEMQRI